MSHRFTKRRHPIYKGRNLRGDLKALLPDMSEAEAMEWLETADTPAASTLRSHYFAGFRRIPLAFS